LSDAGDFLERDDGRPSARCLATASLYAEKIEAKNRRFAISPRDDGGDSRRIVVESWTTVLFIQFFWIKSSFVERVPRHALIDQIEERPRVLWRAILSRHDERQAPGFYRACVE